MLGAQETTCWAPGNEWFWSRKSLASARGTKGWGQGNQWLGTRYPKVGAQETNGWSPGNKALDTFDGFGTLTDFPLAEAKLTLVSLDADSETRLL